MKAKSITNGLCYIVATCALLFALGCATVGKQIDRAAVEQIKTGDTRERVLSLIGKPDSKTRDTASGRESWSWMHIHATAFSSQAQSEYVTVTFGSDGKVENVNTSFSEPK